MPLIKWEPLFPFDLDTLFEPLPELKEIGWDLATDVIDKDETIEVKINLPGITPDNYEVSIDENVLTVKGSREEETETKDKNYVRREIRRGSFMRSVPLPEVELKADEMTTATENGVLTVRIPKA